jgi:hypothetical protein
MRIKKHLSAADIAEIFRISTQTIYDLVKAEKLRNSSSDPKRYRFSVKAVENYDNTIDSFIKSSYSACILLTPSSVLHPPVSIKRAKIKLYQSRLP